jgi:hypothetical protein
MDGSRVPCAPPVHTRGASPVGGIRSYSHSLSCTAIPIAAGRSDECATVGPTGRSLRDNGSDDSTSRRVCCPSTATPPLQPWSRVPTPRRRTHSSVEKDLRHLLTPPVTRELGRSDLARRICRPPAERRASLGRPGCIVRSPPRHARPGPVAGGRCAAQRAAVRGTGESSRWHSDRRGTYRLPPVPTTTEAARLSLATGGHPSVTS